MFRDLEFRMSKLAFHPTSGKPLCDHLTRKSDIRRLDIDDEYEKALVKEIKANIPSKEEFEEIWAQRKAILEKKEE